MILSASAIRVRGVVRPFHERMVRNGMSFGLGSAGYDIRVAEDHTFSIFRLFRRFQLASSMEEFSMPNDLLAVVHDKSTWIRRGLSVHNTVLEPGWRGYLTLELAYHGYGRLSVKAGDPIAQIVFHMLDFTTSQPYTGKYQDQPAGPQPAKMEVV